MLQEPTELMYEPWMQKRKVAFLSGLVPMVRTLLAQCIKARCKMKYLVRKHCSPFNRLAYPKRSAEEQPAYVFRYVKWWNDGKRILLYLTNAMCNRLGGRYGTEYLKSSQPLKR